MTANIDELLGSAKPPSSEPRISRKSFWRRAIERREVVLLLLNIAFVLVVSQLTPYFLYAENGFANIRVLLVGMAMEMIVLAPMVILLIGGMFDLSVDGVVNMTGVITGSLLVLGVPIPVAIVAGFLSALVIGLVNGVAVTKFKMNPLMTTLGTWWIAQGVALGVAQGIPPNTFPPDFKILGQGAFLGITMPAWYALILVPIAVWVLWRTKFGYHVYATGGNREASRLHGVKVDRVTIISFVLVALAAALAGMVYAARFNSAGPQTVNGLNLRIIAGAVIGGCSLSGGEGTIWGGLLGLLFMNMLTNASVVLGISPYWQMCILGGVLLLAVGADALAKRRAPSS
jgi:ribose transport system permease protein